MIPSPRGFLIDYGDTLVEELREDRAAGDAWLFAQASYVPRGVFLADVLARAEAVRREINPSRIPFEIEMPWPQFNRLIHGPLGIRFDSPSQELELGAWQRIVETRPMSGARDALARLRAHGIPLGVVSNTCFGPASILYELEKHDLAAHLEFVATSSEYGVRKPNALLFEAAATRLGVAPRDIWFVGDRLDKDVAGAKRAGMTAVWFEARPDAAKGGDPAGEAPDLVVRSWAELLAAAEKHGLTRA